MPLLYLWEPVHLSRNGTFTERQSPGPEIGQALSYLWSRGALRREGLLCPWRVPARITGDLRQIA